MNTNILWLVFEKPPHPNAVIHPANESDANLALDMISRPVLQRQKIVVQLRNFLKQQAKLPQEDRTDAPVRNSCGLILLISWRFAKWLSLILIASDSQLEQTEQRIRNWLEQRTRSQANMHYLNF